MCPCIPHPWIHPWFLAFTTFVNHQPYKFNFFLSIVHAQAMSCIIQIVVYTCTFACFINLSDPTLTTDSVAESMELVNDWTSLHIVPPGQLREIQQRCSTKREIANECASYYVHCHPHSSWTYLASRLYEQREFAAVETLKPFLPLRGKDIMLT